MKNICYTSFTLRGIPTPPRAIIAELLDEDRPLKQPHEGGPLTYDDIRRAIKRDRSVYLRPMVER